MSFPLTKAQKKGVTTFDRDLCVIAGAGSGKTRVLVERFIHMIVTKRASVREILAITFTEKAALEMKLRISSRLEKIGREEDKREAEFAYISTIHGLCARLLREYSIEAGVDPSFRVMEELDAGRIREEVIDEVLGIWKENKEEKLDLFLNGIDYRSKSSLQGLRKKGFQDEITGVYEKIRNAGKSVSEIFISRIKPEDLNRSQKKVLDYLVKIRKLYQEEELTLATRQKIEAVLSHEAMIKGILKYDFDFTQLEALKRFLNSIKLQVSLKAKPLLRGLREEASLFKGQLIEKYAERIKDIAKEFLVDFDRYYSRKKKVQSLLDFSDLEVGANQLFLKSPDICKQIKNRFKYILVDEFQDISYLQKTIIDYLRGEGNFFTVGDAKQSIYGFRHAEVQIFLDYQEEVSKKGGAIVSLKETFRSRPEIIDFINYHFETRDTFNACLKGEFEKLKPRASFSSRNRPAVEIIISDSDDDMDELRRWEALRLASHIKDLVERKELVVSNRESEEFGRPLSFRDFVILFRSTTGIRTYERALGDAGVPYYLVTGRGFFHAREIVDVINLLKVINHPWDEIILASVLKSPFLGIGEEELFWISTYAHNNKPPKRIYNILSEIEKIPEISPQYGKNIARFYQLIKDLRVKKSRLEIRRLLETAFERTGYDSKILFASLGRQRYANLQKLLGLAGKFEESGLFELDDFIEMVDDYRFRDLRESEAPTGQEKDDLVKLMTIHGAKGLEFPVVIVADLGRSSMQSSYDFAYSIKNGLSLKLLNHLTNEAEFPISYEQFKIENRKREEEESQRLFYVAMTRAQEHLILSGSRTKGRRRNWLDDILDSMNLNRESLASKAVIPFGGNRGKVKLILDKKGKSKRVSPAKMSIMSRREKKILNGEEIEIEIDSEVAKEGKGIMDRTKRVLPPSRDFDHYLYTVTEIETFHRCPRQYFLKFLVGIPNNGSKEYFNGDPGDSSPFYREDELFPREMGNIVHRVLSRHRPGTSSHPLSLLINQELSLKHSPDIFPGDFALTIKAWVENFYSSEVGREVISARQVKRETSFIFKYHGKAIRGQIDLFYFNDKGQLKVVDYKTDNIKGKEVAYRAKHYQLQMQLYCLALKRIYRIFPERAALYFLNPNEMMEVNISAKKMGEMEEILQGFYSSQATKNFPAKSGTGCKWCYCRHLCNFSVLR